MTPTTRRPTVTSTEAQDSRRQSVRRHAALRRHMLTSSSPRAVQPHTVPLYRTVTTDRRGNVVHGAGPDWLQPGTVRHRPGWQRATGVLEPTANQQRSRAATERQTEALANAHNTLDQLAGAAQKAAAAGRALSRMFGRRRG